MSCEVNVESIPALLSEIIQPQRTQNSPNIAHIPPEILGHIFQFVITPKTRGTRFPSIEEASYNFLAVCHHWNEVARRTPELWTSWGNSLPDWRRLYLKNGTSILDLVLGATSINQASLFDEDIQNTLRDRAARDVVRKVHLGTWSRELTNSILSSLTPEDEDIRHSSVESIDLSNADPSNFFARHLFSKLRNLSLHRCTSSSLDSLKFNTPALANFTLFNDADSPAYTPTVSQILSILASNSNIRTLELESGVFHDNGEHRRVPLRHLESIAVKGEFRQIFPILDRLEFQTTVNETEFIWFSCTSEDIKQVIGPYIRDYLDDVGFKNRLGVSFLSLWDYISLEVSVIDVGCLSPEQLPQESLPHAEFTMYLSEHAPLDARMELYTNILALLPKERIVYFRTDSQGVEGMIVGMQNLEFLYLIEAVVSNGFLLPEQDGPNASKKLLPSLRRLYIQPIAADDNDWDPLVYFLTQQAVGGQPISLGLSDKSVHICSGVLKEIEGLVKEFTYVPHPIVRECPLPGCADEVKMYRTL